MGIEYIGPLEESKQNIEYIGALDTKTPSVEYVGPLSKGNGRVPVVGELRDFYETLIDTMKGTGVTVAGGTIGAIAGLREWVGTRSADKAESVAMDVAKRYSELYEPQTEVGKSTTQTVAKILGIPAEIADEVVSMPLESWKVPKDYAYPVKLLSEFAAYGGVGKGVKSIAKRVEPKASPIEAPTVKTELVEPKAQEAVKVSEDVPVVESVKPEVVEQVKQAEPVVEVAKVQEPVIETPRPLETAMPEGNTTAIKKDVVTAEREVRGLEEAEVRVRVELGDEFVNGIKNDVESGTRNPKTLAQSIIDNPRPLRPEEGGTLLVWRTSLNNAHRKVMSEIEGAMERGDMVSEHEARLRLKDIEDDLAINDSAARQASYQWGVSGKTMQMVMAEDYSLASMIQRAKVDRGVKELPDDVRAKYEQLSKQIEEAQKQLDAKDELISKLQADRKLKRVRSEVSLEKRNNRRAYAKSELDAEFNGLRNELSKIFGGTQLNAGIDPTAAIILGKMAKNRVQSGIVTAKGVVDAVYTAVKEMGFDISLREVRDAISGYGVTSKMSQEALAVQLRELRHQMRLVSALEDAKSQKAPLRSGLQRDPISNEVRELDRQVKQAMKESGIDSRKARSPEEQWRTALDAVKTRLRNQIFDLEKQLKTGEKSPKKVGVQYDAEATALKEVRDKLKATLEQIEGKRQISPEQKTKNAISAVERSIAEYERRIAAKELEPIKKESTTPVTPELAKLREVRDGLRVVYQQMQKDAKPGKSPEEVALQQYRTRLARQVNEYERKLAESDFATKQKKEIPMDKVSLELRHKLDKAKRAYHEARFQDQLSRRTFLQQMFDSAKEVVNTPRTLITSFDVSAPFRQGAFIFFSHPIRGAKTLPDMFKALLSDKERFRVDQEILNRKNYPLYERSKLYLSEHGKKLSDIEEVYQSRWAEKIPFFGRGVAASQRAYTTFLNKLRADSFDVMVENLTRKGKATPEELEAIANYINVATGRGKLAVDLNTVFFAPRYVASRFQTILGQPFIKGSARTRTAIAKEYARFLIGAGVVLELGHLAGADIELDPRSSDFGKMRFGNTRLDPLGGLSQSTVFLARIASGTTKDSKGHIQALRDDPWAAPGKKVRYGKSDIGDVLWRFMRTKLSPFVGTSLDAKTGKDVVGNKVELEDMPGKLLVPLAMRDIYEAMKEQGVSKAAALSLLSLFGMGMSTYGNTKDKPLVAPWHE